MFFFTLWALECGSGWHSACAGHAIPSAAPVSALLIFEESVTALNTGGLLVGAICWLEHSLIVQYPLAQLGEARRTISIWGSQLRVWKVLLADQDTPVAESENKPTLVCSTAQPYGILLRDKWCWFKFPQAHEEIKPRTPTSFMSE